MNEEPSRPSIDYKYKYFLIETQNNSSLFNKEPLDKLIYERTYISTRQETSVRDKVQKIAHYNTSGTNGERGVIVPHWCTRVGGPERRIVST